MEEYRTITGFENYSISNLGNVKNNTTNKLLNSRNNKGYKRIILSKEGKATDKGVHRLVADAFIPNPDNKPLIDHINNIRDDNRVENLRWATYAENNKNQKISPKNTSGFKGITYEKGKWRARIFLNNKTIHIGVFNTKEEAIEARVLKAFELFGEFMNECEKIQYDIILLNKQKEQQNE